MNTPDPARAPGAAPASGPSGGQGGGPSQVQQAIRPWIGVYFACSNMYTRVSRSPEASSYRARCPKCGKSVRFRVAPGGSDARFFEVSC